MLGAPRDHLGAGGAFPDGELDPDAPVAARYARVIAVNLRDALAGRNQSRVCEQADVARSTVNDIVTGRTYPELVTIAKLETVLDTRLWADTPGAGAGDPEGGRGGA